MQGIFGKYCTQSTLPACIHVLRACCYGQSHQFSVDSAWCDAVVQEVTIAEDRLALVELEEIMLLDTWYTVMSYPPSCRAYLDKSCGKGTLSLAALLVRSRHIVHFPAQLTLGAIVAQVYCAQLQLKAGGCVIPPPDLHQELGIGTFDEWLCDFQDSFIDRKVL